MFPHKRSKLGHLENIEIWRSENIKIGHLKSLGLKKKPDHPLKFKTKNKKVSYLKLEKGREAE